MGKNQSASNLPNIIQYSNGSINFVSGSTLLMQISSSGAITTTGVISGSNALSSSYASNSERLDNLDSTSFVFTSSYNSDSSSFSTRTTNLETASGSFSTRVTKIEGNYATTGSNIFTGAQTVCANITSTGTIIAQTLNVQQVTSSIVYSSGSNTFGNQLTDVQQMTGSVRITGSICSSGDIILNSGKSLKFASNANSYVAEEYGIRLNLGGDTTQYGTQFYNSSGTKVAMIDATGGACFSGLQICSSADPSFYFYRSACSVGSGIGRIYWNGLDSTSTVRTYAYVQSAIEACSSTALCSRLEFILASNNNIDRVFQINGAGVACFTGNVCAPSLIGSSIICSAGTVYAATNIRIGSTSAAGNATDPGITTGGCTKTGIYFDGSCVALGSGGNSLLLAQNGNVGIGTTSPLGSLQIITIPATGRNTLIMGQSPASGTDYIGFIGYNAYYNTSGVLTHASSNGRGAFVIEHSAAAAGSSAATLKLLSPTLTNEGYITINNSNVGINTTTPCGKLQISLGTVANGCFRNSSGGEAALTIEACGNSYLQFMNCATSQTGIMFGNTCLQYSGMIWYRHDAKQLMLGAGGTETMYICGGRVGVATSTPSAGFHSIGSLKYQNNTYNGFAQSFVWQSSFNNPPQLLYQFTSGNNYAQTLVKVTFIQNGVSAGYAGWFVGYALAHRNPTALTTVAYAMTAEHNPNGITAPTLSWSGCALCITPNRATNYDGYVVYVEWAGNTNNNSTPEIPV